MKKTSAKRALTVVLLSLFILATSQMVFSENPDVYDFTISAGQATITGYLGDPPISGSITIPSSVAIGSVVYPVIAIANHAFQDVSGITQVAVSSGIATIGTGAFYNCTGITSVSLPDSVTSIGSYAFFGCSNLTSITLPNSMLTIGEAAFAGCSDLSSVTIPAGLTAMAPSLFAECTSLNSVSIPATITQIGDHAFFFCSSLAAAHFLGNAPVMGAGVFDECASLFTVLYAPEATGFAAQWNGYPAEITPSHVVSFKDWDGFLLEQQKIGHGQSAITPPVPVRSGYSFTGWDQSYGSITADIVITAQYQVNSYTLSFNSNGGSAIAGMTQNYGTAISAPANPTRSGYTFAGWNPAVPTTMPASNTTVTAQWTINQYTITFDSNGGSLVASIIQNYGSAVVAPANPTRYGYVFAGWDPAIPAAMPAGNMTLTAQWSSTIPSTITSSYYSANAGTGYLSKISIDTSVASLVSHLNEWPYIHVFSGGTEVTGTTLAATGMVVRLMDGSETKHSLTVAITGDINGDGQISLTDFVRLKSHMLGINTLSGAYATASDINGDGSISLTDYVKMKAHLLGSDLVIPRIY